MTEYVREEAARRAGGVDRKGKTLVIQEWASEECFPGGATRRFI